VAATSSSALNLRQFIPEIRAADVRQHVAYLASDHLEGRFTGTEGERLATAYVAAMFEGVGLTPAGDHGTFFQAFEFTAGVSLGGDNQLTAHPSTERLPQTVQPTAQRTGRGPWPVHRKPYALRHTYASAPLARVSGAYV
jgi:hypothetical protein